MASGKGSGSRTWISWIIAVIGFLAVALALVIAAAVTPHWIDTVIGRTSTTTDADKCLAFSRYQGLFKTCYTGGDITLLPSQTMNRNTLRDTLTASDDECIIEEGYSVWTEEGTKYDHDYLIRAHALRATAGALAAGAFLLIVAILLALCAMCSNGKGIMTAVGIVAIFAAIFLLAGMGFFTWVYFLQFQQLGANYPEFWNGWKQNTAYQAYENLSKINFGWSFMLGWIGCGMALIGAFIAFCTLCCNNSGSDDASVPLTTKKAAKGKKQMAEPQYNTQYIPQEMMAPATQRVDVVRVPTQQTQIIETTPVATMTRFEQSPPAYYNTPAVIYRPQNVTAAPGGVPMATPFYQGEKPGNAGYGVARIYNDAASNFTPREYIDASQKMDIL